MRLLLALILLAASAPGALAQADDTRSYPDGVAAVVEGEPITRRELELACRLREDYRRFGDGPSRRTILAEELEELIRQRVLLRKVRGENIEFTKSDEKRLQWELTRRARDRRGLDGLKADLESIGVPFDYFVERQKTSILVGKLLVKTISRNIFVTPDEVRRFYHEHPERFRSPGELRLRQIVLYQDLGQAYRPAPPALADQVKEGWDAKATAEALRRRVLAGEDFRELASQASMGVHHAKDEVYDSSTRLRDVLASPVDRIAAELPPGEVSEVITTPRGSAHLLLVIHRREPGVVDLSEVQREIEAELKEKAWRERLDAWIKKVRAEAHVEVFVPRDPR